MKKNINLILINFILINIILLYINQKFNGLALNSEIFHPIELPLTLISYTFYYWVKHLINLISIIISLINIYSTQILKFLLIDLLQIYLELIFNIQTIFYNLNFNLFPILELGDHFLKIFDDFITSSASHSNEYLHILKKNIIFFIYSLYFYFKIKIIIKFWIFSKLIIKIIKNKLAFKLLSYFSKIPKCWIKSSRSATVIYFYIQKNSILKYFIIFIFISLMTPYFLESNYLSIIIFVFIRYGIWNLKKFFHSINLLTVIPLGLSLPEAEEDNNTNLESEDENIETINFTNFNNLPQQERQKYVESQIKLKGLTSNIYLIDFLIAAILRNVKTGSQLEVENFLNKDLNILLKEKRNIQLNNHSFIRIKPFLLNNSNNTGFPNVVPFKPDKTIELD